MYYQSGEWHLHRMGIHKGENTPNPKREPFPTGFLGTKCPISESESFLSGQTIEMTLHKEVFTFTSSN